MKIGDLILKLDDKVMENSRQFDVNLYQKPLDSIVKLEVLRGSEKIPIQVTVLERSGGPDRLADLLSGETRAIPRLGILADRRLRQAAR